VTKRFDPDGYHTACLEIDEHTGTHVDAPSHSLPPEASAQNPISIDLVPLDRVVGPARVLDATPLCDAGSIGESPLVREELIASHERQHGEIEGGEVVLLHTGWDRHFVAGPAGAAYAHGPRVEGTAPGWPAPDVASIELLLARGVTCIGTDAPTIGPLQDPVPVHQAGLRAGLVFVEGLTNLGRLPPRGAFFVCLPLKVAGGSGAPARAVAFVPGEGEA
jgi:kynurenine formamidase